MSQTTFIQDPGETQSLFFCLCRFSGCETGFETVFETGVKRSGRFETGQPSHTLERTLSFETVFETGFETAGQGTCFIPASVESAGWSLYDTHGVAEHLKHSGACLNLTSLVLLVDHMTLSSVFGSFVYSFSAS